MAALVLGRRLSGHSVEFMLSVLGGRQTVGFAFCRASDIYADRRAMADAVRTIHGAGPDEICCRLNCGH